MEKQSNYKIVMMDFMRKFEDKQIDQKGRQDDSVWAGEMKEETLLIEWATSKNLKTMNTQYQKQSGRRWTGRIPEGNTNN